MPGPDGVHGTADDTVSHFKTSVFGSTDPEGVEYDPATGRLAICDGVGLEVYLVDPVNGAFGDGDDLVTSFDVAQYGLTDCEGLGIDPVRNALLVIDWTTDAIYEFSMSGALLRTLELSAIPTDNRLVAGVTMAPSSNPNDSPSAMNYWIVDRHVDNKANPLKNHGLLYEMKKAPPPPTLLNLPISSGANDADQALWGTVHRSPGDIQLGTGALSMPSTAALRFTGVQIPKGATIVNTQVQFTVDEVATKAANLVMGRARRQLDTDHDVRLQPLLASSHDSLGRLVPTGMADPRGRGPGSADAEPGVGGPGGRQPPRLGARQRAHGDPHRIR